MAKAFPHDAGTEDSATGESDAQSPAIDPDSLAWQLLVAAELCLVTANQQRREALCHLDRLLDQARHNQQLSCDEVALWQRVAQGEQLPAVALWGGQAQLPWRLRAGIAPLTTTPGELPEQRSSIRQQLARQWEIDDRHSLIETLLWLSAQGDRYSWDIDARELEQLTAEDRLTWRTRRLIEEQAKGIAADPTETRRTALLVDWVESHQPLEWAAWDWLRLAELACQGTRCGWLSEEEGRLFTVHAVQLMQQRYDSWEALVAAYQRGRCLLLGPPDEAEQERWQLLLTARVSPWQMPLAELIDERDRHAARTFMLQLRGQAWQFAMALAAIRDPGLVARCGARGERSPEHSDEARRYLEEMLEWRPEDDDLCLTRCWQPALVHCLNQCAADAVRGVMPLCTTPFGSAEPQEIEERNALAACASHSATIHMAEKYAFHLIMAWDAKALDSARFVALTEALRATLCCFYVSAQQLLDAWLSWETALSSTTQASLAAELEWHLNDPGSVLKWVSWQGRGAFSEPGERPSLKQFTALALIGPLNAAQWTLPVKAGKRAAATLIDWLDSHYGIAQPEALVAFLDFLAESGDRQEYQINYAPYTLNPVRLESEIAILESAARSENEQVHLERLRRVMANTEGCNDYDLAAWDIAQLVDLASAGVSVGWLTPDQLSHYLELAEGLASRHYSGWQEYAHGLLAGVSFFMAGDSEQQGVVAEMKQALVAWLSGAPPLSGSWSCLTFPGQSDDRWPSMHIDTLGGDRYTLH
ncbi:hypothetical protein R84981_001960 [Carnimonas sp. R-84981]|uniref:DUF1266 domain-containing protein n=1 Tax=Carnimonas bestiolae TaxID=3402172 RepID=UPI003EDC1595